MVFSRFEVTRGDSNCSLKNYSFLYDAIFYSCVHMHTKHLIPVANLHHKRWQLLIESWSSGLKALDRSWEFCVGTKTEGKRALL